MAAKLKVFTWSDGFHAYTVATTSRAKALSAWGVTRDLFKDGDAREITGGPDHDAALATPGDTVKRGLAVDIGKLKPVAKLKAPSKADQERVAALERELASLKADHEAAAAALAQRRARLDQDEEVLERDHAKSLRDLQARLEAARRKLDG